MIKLSSGFTILFKFFIPVFWTVFFGSAIVAFFFVANEDIYTGSSNFKLGIVAFYLIWILLMYFTIFQLKRVEGNLDGLFISNYFKHMHIPFDRISEFAETNLGLFLLVRVNFTSKTYFGKKVYFLASKRRFEEFVRINAEKLVR